VSIVPAEVEGRFLILGAGPAGHTAAMVAAELGAPVTIIEPSVLGGEAHLLDCIPSKTMVATSRRADSIRNAAKLGIVAEPGRVDLGDLATRIETIVSDLGEDVSEVLRRQGVQIIEGRGRLTSSHMASALTSDGEVEISFESGLIATGSSPRWNASTAARPSRVPDPPSGSSSHGTPGSLIPPAHYTPLVTCPARLRPVHRTPSN